MVNEELTTDQEDLILDAEREQERIESEIDEMEYKYGDIIKGVLI